MSDPQKMNERSGKEVEFEFQTRSDTPISIWVEPSCQNIVFEPGFEYKLVAWENYFRIEFDQAIGMVLYLQHSNEYKLYKRACEKGVDKRNEWELEYDLSDL
jgi:hypothetical protein